MEVRLKVLNGAKSGQVLAVRTSKFFVGRDEDCHLRPKSDLISRHHCVLLVDESGIVVRDLGSRNGTYVNGQRISLESELKDGDELKIGPLEFRLLVRETTGAKKRPKVTSIKEAAARTAEGSSQDDLDVSDWLTDEQTEHAATETQEIDLSIGNGPTPDEPTPSPPESAKAPAKPVQQRPPRSVKTESSDSTEAAADVLRKFFKRR